MKTNYMAGKWINTYGYGKFKWLTQEQNNNSDVSSIKKTV